MNFDELEADIKSLEQTAKDFKIGNSEEFERAKRFSQSCSSITIWLNKLQLALSESNKLIAKKIDEYNRKPQASAQSPSPNACVACSGTGKASNGASCKPCGGTGKKASMSGPEKDTPAKAIPAPVKNPSEPNSAKGPVQAPKKISLDDFDEGPLSEEDELTAELQKTLF